MKNFRYITTEEYNGERVDKCLSELLESLSRSFIQRQIESGSILVNQEAIKSNYRLKTDDIIEFEIPDAVEPTIEAEDIPVTIVYEDDDVAIVNKPQGMVVHPSAGHYTGTLVNALLFHMHGRLSGINGILRPGIVHRIDKDTSGLLIICKSDLAHNVIASQLKEHTANRKYHAIVRGVISEAEGTVNKPIGRSPKDRKKMAIVQDGKEAITHFKVLERFRHYTYVECRLETGRTHQIRVHMASIGHPLMGDPVYSNQKEPIALKGQVLHAKTIGITHPITKERMKFDSDLPEYFIRVLEYLRRNDSN